MRKTLICIFYPARGVHHFFDPECNLQLDASATYEEIIELLIREQFLLPLDPPLRYNLVLDTSDVLISWKRDIIRRDDITRVLEHPGRRPKYYKTWRLVTLREGQNLESIFLTADRLFRYPVSFECAITIETAVSPPPRKKPSSTSPSLSETITTVATTATNVLVVTASVATIIQTLIVVLERWEKTHHMGSASSSRQFDAISIVV